ncbi:RNA polymerase sigma factor [Candidatus Oscillochloris fontis]|uniref:RNA polymerase sigma factor n=1 Tax=Candidatus Oscillochloris fontis TaxID=2496868 RepID=UPI0015826BB6|nr:sigma-70 family RNA polymerase sigma factor [Candidatus Oscillochloris fontis]
MPGPTITITVYDDEQQLLQGLRHHDPDSCTCLVKRFAPLVYARAMRLVGDPDEAEGILQTTFIKACHAIDNFDGTSGLGTWLYRIATNEGLMHLRSRRQALAIDDVADTLQPEDMPGNRMAWPEDPLRSTLDSELRREIEAAIAELPASLRLVVTLRDMEGLSTEETAEHLGISVGAVKVRLHRARLRLRESLAAYMSRH